MGVKLGGTLIEEGDTGVGYVTFKGLFEDFCLMCCGFVCYCNTIQGIFLVVKVFFFPCVLTGNIWERGASLLQFLPSLVTSFFFHLLMNFSRGLTPVE